jgi:polysaccharide pyruvyl transferase WcaK-like protein
MYIDSGRPDAKTLLHIGVHNSANRNAGDTLLFPVVRRAFDTVLGPFNWKLQQAWEAFTPETAAVVNASTSGIVIGGGGLLLRDQAGSDVSNSGWQWNSTVEAVRTIEVPLAIFAIGYNRFRGQADFDSVFRDHIQAVAKKAGFFGLRNTGSIQALSQYLLPQEAHKLVRQYCPTNVLWQLYPEYRAKAKAHDAKQRRVLAFNAAFDRASLRFGERQDDVLAGVAQAVLAAQKRGWEIVMAAHKTMDRDIEPYLDAAGVEYETVDLTDAGPEQIMAFYAEVDCAFGMRGHAQMIPFGLRRPIMSIISHDKMRFLLDDIEHPEWGVEVDALDIAVRLERFLVRLELDRAAAHEEIAMAQSKVWGETQSNLQAIGRLMLPTSHE